MSEACARNDLVERNVSWLLWRVPMLAFVIGAFLTPTARALLWVPAFLSCLTPPRLVAIYLGLCPYGTSRLAFAFSC